MRRADSNVVVEALVSHLVAHLNHQISHGVGLYVDMPEHAGNLIRGRREAMRAVLVLLPDFMGSRAYQQPIASVRETIARELDRFDETLEVFARFREATEEELRAAATTARSAYSGVIEAVRQLIKEGEFEMQKSFFRSTAECEVILNLLFETFGSERR